MNTTTTSIESANGYRLRFVDKKDKPDIPEDLDLSTIIKSKNGYWARKIGEHEELGTQVYYSKDRKRWIKGYRDRKSSYKGEGNNRTQVGKYIYRAKDKGTTVATIGRNVITWYTANNISRVNYSREIDHLDGDYTNDRLSNLERVTPGENIKRRNQQMEAKLQLAGALA